MENTNWKGYSFEELRYQRALTTIKCELEKDQLKEIAETKLPDLNCYTVEEAMKIVEGTALNMGVKVED